MHRLLIDLASETFDFDRISTIFTSKMSQNGAEALGTARSAAESNSSLAAGTE